MRESAVGVPIVVEEHESMAHRSERHTIIQREAVVALRAQLLSSNPFGNVCR